LTPEGKPIGVAPAAIPREGYRPQWINHGPPVQRIVEMISRYLYLDAPDDKFEATGREALKSVISRFVDGGERIELVFPGFPFKSPGKDRVLGTLPDFAEELLLRRLEMLASSIEDYYSPGAIVRIVSDGVVYGGQCIFSLLFCYSYHSLFRNFATI
jgi:pyoverdine/dityrosine biosynthesis protein Dit1